MNDIPNNEEAWIQYLEFKFLLTFGSFRFTFGSLNRYLLFHIMLFNDPHIVNIWIINDILNFNIHILLRSLTIFEE